jgi:hypothetical protein
MGHSHSFESGLLPTTPRKRGRVTLPRDRVAHLHASFGCCSAIDLKFPPFSACSRSMDVRRRSRGSATLPRQVPSLFILC